MASSDDEGEALLPNVVSDYYFLDDNKEPISVSELPLIWEDGERLEGSRKEINLYGTTDNGLQKIFEQVMAWKFDCSSAKLEIFVLSKKKNWIKLLKPRKIFEETIRTTLITVHCLHILKRNPETTGKALWDRLAKVFSLYEPRPSENDLVDHMNLIGDAVKRDEILARSKVLVTFLQEKPQKKKVFDEEGGFKTMSGFIVDVVTDDNGDDENGEDGSSDEEDDFYESVCAICDNGGDLLCCGGKCLRSFHATEEAGSDSACESLGFSNEQYRLLLRLRFECKNCQYKQHQCYICGELGSSDKSVGAEVFQCVTGTCGYFYHPRCVAEALCFKDGDKSKDLEGRIAAGEPFTCPLHMCHVCKEREPEDKNDLQLQFAVCRRCPRAYHRKCLPRKIAFEDDEDKNVEQRAWEGLLPNKILIYCLKHKIVDDLATPVRDHVRFPDTDEKKKKRTLEPVFGDKNVPKRRVDAAEDAAGKNFVAKRPQGTNKKFAGKKLADSSAREERLAMTKSLKKPTVNNNSKVALNKALAGKRNKNSGVEAKPNSKAKDSEPKREISDINQQNKTGKPAAEDEDDSLVLDADSKRRILSILREAESSITLEDVKLKRQGLSTNASFSKYDVQNITLGKLEGAIEALRAALQKLEVGGSLEDAKAVCEPGLLNQLVKWRSRLKVFLAPVLHGPRYTSFGRHFTKVEKLQSIVDKLHCYVQDGDMIVDFCCGANDFSCLMKQKLDQLGKNCGYKNYDCLPAKNDFNFEKRDWMTVLPSELPPGSQLIMGLNPPFGVNASLAYKLIGKALGFKPKLLILIAPGDVRLDENKKRPYDLVWEDAELLRGKSFYLPGSVDVNGKQMDDWNVIPPTLSLWSHPDWTTKHKAIALENSHLSKAEQGFSERDAPDCKPGTSNLDHETCMVAGGLQDVKQHREGAKLTENGMEALLSQGTGVKESHVAHGHGKDQANNTFEEGNKNNRKRGRGGEKKSSERRSLPRLSSPDKSGSRSLGNHLPKHPEMDLHTDVQRECYQRFDHNNLSGLQMRLQRGNGAYHGDGTGRRNSYGEERFLNVEDRRAYRTSHGSDYGFVIPEEQFMGYRGDHANVHGYDAHMSNINEGYRREQDIRAQVRMYGHQYPEAFNHRDGCYASAPSVLPSSYNQHGPAANSAYNSMNTSTMQRYAPRLDELNHTAMSNMGSMQPYAGISGRYNPPPRSEFQPDSLGFAPGPYRPYSETNSSGWLNE